MIPNQNCEIFASILFYLLTKFLCTIFSFYNPSMYKHSKLSSIPEKNETEDDLKTTKWVPKKKHEVLKAKYKCLKKLFQIYDASVIGILPETVPDDYTQDSESRTKYSRRKKRSHRTKTDACADTNEVSSGDVTMRSDDKSTIATAVIKDLKIQCSCSTQMICDKSPKSHESKEIISNSSSERDCEFTQTDAHQQLQPPLNINHPIPYLMYNEKRKPTRFQSFINRLFGVRRERPYRNYVAPNGHVYAASDNNITHNCCERRRRRGLRFRRLRRPKKVHSEIALRDLKSPTILTYVQSVQRNCLMDTTPRQCPIVGCKMMFYGIINYNDHLNLCHFTDRKFICHYCHEGFEREYDKYVHENEHLGITKLNFYPSSTKSLKKVSNTQTDPITSRCDFPEEKLKKIVSFFDKIADTEQMLAELKKDRYSESNLQIQRSSKATTEATETDTSSSDKRTVSCGNLLNRKIDKSKTTLANSDKTSKYLGSPVKCHLCGENFDYRRQLSLHVDLEHRVHDKYSKFHSCAGITNTRADCITGKGKINVQSISNVQRIDTSSTLTQDTYSARRKSDESLSCDPSTNIIYYESTDNVRKPSVLSNFVDKVRSGVTSYRWEPGTKIIRV